jgi:hypothetical protein
MIGHYTVTKFKDINEKIIPFFDKYPLIGTKMLNFASFKLVTQMMENKEHLTVEGIEKIKIIKSGMNTGKKQTIDSKTRSQTNLSRLCLTKAQKRNIHTRVKTMPLIGFHGQYSVSVIVGLLLFKSVINRSVVELKLYTNLLKTAGS